MVENFIVILCAMSNHLKALNREIYIYDEVLVTIDYKRYSLDITIILTVN